MGYDMGRIALAAVPKLDKEQLRPRACAFFQLHFNLKRTISIHYSIESILTTLHSFLDIIKWLTLTPEK